VATAVARTTAGSPLNSTVEVAGPEQFGLDDLVRTGLAFRGDPRTVVADPDALYFGERLSESMLLPGAEATVFDTRFDEWLKTNPAPAAK